MTEASQARRRSESLFARAIRVLKEAPALTREESNKVLHEARQRRWLQVHGLTHRVDFSDAQREVLRNYFSAMDGGKSRYISIDQLEQVLTCLGIADTREDVERFAKSKIKRIDFNDFLKIIVNGDSLNSENNKLIFLLFNELIEKKNYLNFNIKLLEIRRNGIIESLTSHTANSRNARIMRSFLRLNRKDQTSEDSDDDSDEKQKAIQQKHQIRRRSVDVFGTHAMTAVMTE